MLLTNILLSQELQKTSSRDKYGLQKSFTVLKSDNMVRHGDFTMTFDNDIYQKGFYNMGKLSGKWTYYYLNNVEFIYDFDTGCIISDTIGTARKALYSNGESYFNYLIFNYLRYPEEPLRKAIQGNVIIDFTINTDGTPENFNIKIGCGNIALNQEALRVVEKVALSGKWYPAINDKGEKIKSTIEKTIHFKLK